MKDLMISQEGSTFTSALKGIRNNPSISSTAHQTSRSSQPNFFHKGPCPSFFSPRLNITKRENTTLKELFIEYQRKPGIEYVLKLKNESTLKDTCAPFDLWIQNCKKQNYIDSQQHQKSISFMEQRRQQIKRQISQNVHKIALKIQNKRSPLIKQSPTIDSLLQDRTTKYSFSQYFTQFSELLQTQISKPEKVTKISIGNFEPIPSVDPTANDDKGCNRDSLNVYFSKSKLSNTDNKQNSQLSSNQTSKKIVGLQFSKNKRFKSTKKKRKNYQQQACSMKTMKS